MACFIRHVSNQGIPKLSKLQESDNTTTQYTRTKLRAYLGYVTHPHDNLITFPFVD